MEKYNCLNCLYSNEIENGMVMCDKKLLLTGKMIIVESEKVELNCPAHSDYPIKEWRYDMGNGLLRDAEDTCCVCSRLVNLNDKDTYLILGGSSLHCKICADKLIDILDNGKES